jgi:beta-lactamase class A
MNHKEQELNKKIKIQKVIIISLIIVLVISLFFISSQKEKQISNQDFPLLDPLRKFTSAENYITNIEDLRNYLQGLGEQYPNSITIYYENINSGANISVNKDLRLFPASLSKLVQAILIVNKVEKGDLSYNQVLKVEKSDLSSESGNLYKTILNDPKTVEGLLEELLVNSDNTAQNIFKHYLTPYDYIDFQNVIGLQDLYNENGFISAKEYTRILRVLYTSNFLRPENSEKILNYMANSTFKDYLSAGIPSDIKFAHKYGENIEYR